MKKITMPFLLFLIFAFLIAFPMQTLEASKSGLLLWFDTLLPTLLPFLIVSQLIMKTDAIHFLEKIFGTFISKIFHCSLKGAFCILCGFLCGYPIGARLIFLALEEKEMELDEAQYLLAFCNNVSPMFCISYGILKTIGTDQIFPYILMVYGSSLLYALLTRPKKHADSSIKKKEQTSKTEQVFQLMDVCIIDSFFIMIKLCGYLMMFTIMRHCILCTLSGDPVVTAVISCILEITGGLSLVSTFDSFYQRELFSILTLSFGGICCILQIQSILHTTKLSLKKYVYSKIIITLLTAVLFFCYKFFVI